MRRALHVALGLAVAAVFLYLTLRQVDLDEVLAAGRGLLPGWALAAPGFLALGYLCRIRRWQRMLRLYNPGIGMGRIGVAYLASIAVNNLLPLRAGDALRCFGFSRWLGVAPGPVVATVVVERLLDLITLILALALALWTLSLDGSALGLARSGGLALGGLALVSLLLLVRPHVLSVVLRALTRLAGAFGPGVRARAEGFAGPLLEALIALSGRHAMPALVGWSALVWGLEGATYWAMAQAVPALSHPEGAWLAMPAGTLATLLPSSPGHVGTFDYFAQAATVATGNPLAAATAFVLITHVVLWAATTVIGSVCLAVWWLAQRPAQAARQ
ncbi:MAG: flippase-like domain-containing protein [Rhodobacteraceae bacterium]|nr:MAG: flippase-like domain-containing protein [Paracoccaceae bacterium]